MCLIPAAIDTPAQSLQTAASVYVVVASGLQDPLGVAVDTSGTIVVSEGRGTITRIAADGSQSILLDGLNGPAGVAFDRDGALIVAEERGGRVLRRDPSGALTVVGAGMFRPRWLAVSDDGTLYVSARGLLPRVENDDDSSAAWRILRISPSGDMTTFADGLRGLAGIAVVGQSLYAALQRVSTDHDTASGARLVRIPIRADGSAGPVEPLLHGDRNLAGLAVDRLGALFAATHSAAAGNPGGAEVLKRLSSGDMVALASGLRDPRGMAFEPAGHLLVVEPGRLLRFHAPPIPVVTTPAFTNQSPLPLNGQAAPGALVQAFHANEFTSPRAAVMADVATGAFTLPTPLVLNAETLVSVVATAAGGLGLSSAPTSHTIVHDDRPPTVAMLAPPAGMHTRDAVTLRARGEDDGSGVESITFRVGDADVAVVHNPNPPEPLDALTLLETRSVAEGPHTLTAVAADWADNTASAAQLIVVDRTPPDTQIVSGPTGEIADATATFTVTGTDLLSPSLEFAWRLDDTAWSAFGPATTIVVSDLTPGEHRFEVKARDAAGNEDPIPAAQTFTVATLRIRITEPIAGTVVTTDGVWVRGTVTGRGVKVVVPVTIPILGLTDLPALVERDTFVARVPVDAATTGITVVATDVTGATQTASVAVVPDPNATILDLQAWPAGGVAPLTVGIKLLNPIESTRATLDADNDGSVDFEGGNLGLQMHTYTQPGMYTPLVEIRDVDGRVHRARTLVQVYDRAALDTQLQAVWRGFKDALRNGDVAAALSFIHSDRRERWQEYFSQFTAAELARIDEVFTIVEMVEVGFLGAQYEMLREHDGLIYSYAIWFAYELREGRWRLERF